MKCLFDDDIDCINATYINKKIFKYLEDEYKIDLSETISISFSTFLKTKGYESSISIFYYDHIFAEVCIESNVSLPDDIANEIEREALLNLKETDAIFFIIRSEYDNDEL